MCELFAVGEQGVHAADCRKFVGKARKGFFDSLKERTGGPVRSCFLRLYNSGVGYLTPLFCHCEPVLRLVWQSHASPSSLRTGAHTGVAIFSPVNRGSLYKGKSPSPDGEGWHGEAVTG